MTPTSETQNVEAPISTAPAAETMVLGKRIAEAVLFAAEEPLDLQTIQAHLPGSLHARDVIDALQNDYGERGIRLEFHGGRYALRTAPDIAPYLQRETVQSRRLSRAALETLAIIAYHQPITRAEIEDIRGVSTNKGTLDLLIETGWVQPKGRRETPGRPVTWVTTPDFLDHLDLSVLDDLPRIEELMQVGLLGSASTGHEAEAADDQDEAPVDEDVQESDDVDPLSVSDPPPVSDDEPIRPIATEKPSQEDEG
ncbi:MAG: SMC-Scp complex subunit ScpB [Geminicoccaceae bacterium]